MSFKFEVKTSGNPQSLEKTVSVTYTEEEVNKNFKDPKWAWHFFKNTYDVTKFYCWEIFVRIFARIFISRSGDGKFKIIDCEETVLKFYEEFTKDVDKFYGVTKEQMQSMANEYKTMFEQSPDQIDVNWTHDKLYDFLRHSILKIVIKCGFFDALNSMISLQNADYHFVVKYVLEDYKKNKDMTLVYMFCRTITAIPSEYETQLREILKKQIPDNFEKKLLDI